MNRILFERDEISDGLATFGGARAGHVLNVLHGAVGQVLKTGEVDGPVGTAEILEIETKADGPRVTVRCAHAEASRRPWIDLLFAPPRPRVMKRLLPQLATMGVGRIVLVGAKKVEKDFWGATLLKPENYRPLLVDGLMQAGTSILPTLETRRNFRKFVTDELDALFPSSARIVAHPYEVLGAGCLVPGAGDDARRETRDVRRETRDIGCETRDARRETVTSHVYRLVSSPAPGTKHPAPGALPHPPLLAIGPEGGWTDEEVALLEAHGFVRRSLGPRILRTDTATISLLAQLMQEYDRC